MRGDPHHRHHPSRVMTTSFGHDNVMSQHASRDVLLAAGPSFHGHHLGGGVRHGNKYGQHHHGNHVHHQQQGSGRSSDPLSTDQGYDTDSCQQLQFGRHAAASSSNQQRRKENVIMTSSANSSRTTEDDESSENDLEVEKINRHNEALLSPADSESMIETSQGGRLSGTDTVTSWAAVKPPKSTSHHHFDHHQVAQQRHSQHFSQGGSSQLPSSYTLPETSESATKAKIDLRAGGVNMITNL